jgi:hypothetical protein
LKPVQAKKFVRPHLKGKKMEVVVMSVITVTTGSINRRTAVQASLGKKVRPFFQNNQSKK